MTLWGPRSSRSGFLGPCPRSSTVHRLAFCQESEIVWLQEGKRIWPWPWPFPTGPIPKPELNGPQIKGEVVTEGGPELGTLSGNRSLDSSPEGCASCFDFPEGHLWDLPILKPQLILCQMEAVIPRLVPSTEPCKSSHAGVDTLQREIALKFHHDREISISF